MELSKLYKNCFIIVALALALSACTDSKNSEGFNSNYSGTQYLYVVSGSCYGGGVALSAGLSTIARFDLNTGAFINIVADYNSLGSGDVPMAITNEDHDHLLALINNGARRIDSVNKDGTGILTYLINTTALNNTVRSIWALADGSLLVSKSSAIEKFNSSKTRVLVGANPYVNNPGSTCATATTLMTSVATLSNGKILYTHAAASPNNKIGLISSTGYSTAANCLAVQAAPATTAMPTALVVHPSGKILVSYGSTTAASNSIYSYDLNPTTNIFSNATSAYADITNVNGPTAMTVDPNTQDVFVANGLSTFNTIERFSFDSTTGLLTRKGTASFIPASIYTRCVSGMMVGN